MMMIRSRMMMMRACHAIFFRGPHHHWSSGVSLVRGRHFRVRRRLLLPTNRKSTPARTSTARECSSWSNLDHYWPGEEKSLFKMLRTFSNSLRLAPRATPSRAFQKSLSAKLHLCCASGSASLNIGLRVVPPHEPGLKLVCSHRPLILLGRVGVPHDSPATRPHREGDNLGTAFVQGLQRLQSGHSGKTHWRPTRLDTRLRSARARDTTTSGGQAEKRQCFSCQWQRGHGHFMQTTTPAGPGDTKARCHALA